jgi:hypothetical protein
MPGVAHCFIHAMQIVLAAAATLQALPRLASDLLGRVLKPVVATRTYLRQAGRLTGSSLVAISLLLSVSRSIAVLQYYKAPMAAWRYVASEVPRLQRAMDSHQQWTVCVGSEWHRFASSFFVPASAELAFVDSPFNGVHFLQLHAHLVDLNMCACLLRYHA